jgi:hypothetical protein
LIINITNNFALGNYLKCQERFCSNYCRKKERLQERTELNSESSKNSWGFIADKQSKVVSEWKIMKRRHKD